VAILDLIFTSLALLGPIILLMMAIGVSAAAADDTPTADQSDLNNLKSYAWIFWIAFVVCLLVVILQLWVAIKLLNATQIGKDPLEAAKMAAVWRIVTIIFTVFVVLGIWNEIMTGQRPIVTYINVAQLILRCIAIYVVGNFIASARQVAATTLPSRMPLGLTVGIGYTYMPTTTTAQNDNDLPKYEDLPEKR